VPAPTPAHDLPRIAELPASQRERLPALKMTMHMWNADPARRFVIVDGRRLVEGDRVGDATVRTIDADGVVLELEGQSLRLPLR
jgi:general secretion pathway protein B